jgi:hypothetical protein
MAAVDVEKRKTLHPRCTKTRIINILVFYNLDPFNILDVENGKKCIQMHQN